MPTALFSDIAQQQNVSSFDDIVSVAPAQQNVASFDDVAAVRPKAPSQTASLSDVVAIHPASTVPVHPASDPRAGQISATPPPTVWERVKQAVTAGIPRYSSRTVYNPKYGDMQVVSPEEAMTPAEQQRHPILTGAGEIAGGLTSPESVALIAGTAGLGEIPGAAAMLPRLMSAGFGAQAIYSAAKTSPEIRAAIARNDAPETLRLLTHAVGNVAMAALATQHAVGGEGAVTGKAKPSEPVETAGPSTVREIPTTATSPIGELLHDPAKAPQVRVADSSAAAHNLLEHDTLLRPVTLDAEAKTTGPKDVATFRLPSARVVSDSYVPVVSQDAILADGVQKIIAN